MSGRGTIRLALALVSVVVLALTVSSASAEPDPDGAYEGAATNVGDIAIDQVAIEFDVTRNGKWVKNWTVWLNAICVVFPGPVELQYLSQTMPAMKVKRDGRFGTVFEHEVEGESARVEVSGRLRGKRVKQGILSYRVGTCYRGEEVPVRWEAQRTGPG